MYSKLVVVTTLLASLFASPQLFADDHANFSFDPIENHEGLYRFSTGSHHAVVWVNDDGILLTDPISRPAAKWLKSELAKRFDVPIRYMVYSHNHVDHVLGGNVFDDPSITVIAHELAYEDIKRTKLPTRLPTVTFNDELSIRMADQTLRLRYHGPNNGRGCISYHFEDHKLLFVVDWIVVGRMPYQDLPGYDIEGMIHSTKAVLHLPWNTFVGGHADIGNKADVKQYLAYLEALYAGVRDGMLAGKSLETLQKELRFDEHKHLKQYEAWRAMNIAGVYRVLEDQSYISRRPDIGNE